MAADRYGSTYAFAAHLQTYSPEQIHRATIKYFEQKVLDDPELLVEDYVDDWDEGEALLECGRQALIQMDLRDPLVRASLLNNWAHAIACNLNFDGAMGPEELERLCAQCICYELFHELAAGMPDGESLQ